MKSTDKKSVGDSFYILVHHGICMKKIALFAFNRESFCFVNVLLNALDMNEKGYDVKVIIEGSATK
jgi:hypothetical protein